MKLDMRGRDLFLQRAQNWWSDCMFDTSLTMVSARIAPLCSTPADVSPLFSARFPAANSFIFGTRTGRNAPPPSERERDALFRCETMILFSNPSLSHCKRERERIGRRQRPSSRFCLDCATVIYSGTISALSEKRIRESRARLLSFTIHRRCCWRTAWYKFTQRTERGMRLECAQRGECVSGVITSSLDGVNGARNAASTTRSLTRLPLHKYIID
jgi:hypothetical protein